MTNNLQTKSKNLEGKPHSQLAIYQDASGDSDKENWVPGTQSSNPAPRMSQTNTKQSLGSQRGVLQENTHIPSHSASLEALMSRDINQSNRREKKAQKHSSGKVGSRVDTEVSKLMGETDLPREEDDLDAVQNLLSLSQGAWH